MVRCSRHYCLCDLFAGSKIELRHITQEEYGGDNSIGNNFSLCFKCHAEAKAYIPIITKAEKIRKQNSGAISISVLRNMMSAQKQMSKEKKQIRLSVNGFQTMQPPWEKTWGVSSIDEECRLNRGMLALFAGESGAGKSALAIRCALKNILLSHSVLYFHPRKVMMLF